MTLALVAGCSSSGSGGGNGGSSSGENATSKRFPVNVNAAGTPKRGGTLHMLGVGDVDYMDPNIVYYTTGYLAARMYSRQLITYPAVVGKTTSVVPDIATQVPSTSNGGITDGGKTVKFTIKKGVQWDTTPARQVTAADEVRGLKRTCNPAQPFGGMPDFESLIVGMQAYCDGFAKVSAKSASAIAGYQNSHDIAGITVDPSDPQTVVFKLTSPASYFVDMTSLTAFSPAPKEYDKYIPAGAEQAQHTISDGPYKITKYNPTKEIDFVRNPAWNASTDTVRKAYVNAVVVNETGNQDSIQTQLAANTAGADMEWDTFPPNTAIPGLIQKKDKNLNINPEFSSNPYIVFNTVSPNNGGALKSVAVRKALSEAMVREHFTVDLAGSAIAPPLTHVLPQGISGTQSNTDPNPFTSDVSKAKKDLAAAGHKQLAIKILYRPDSSTSKAIYLTLNQDLSKAGIKVTGVSASNADFYVKYLEVPSVAKAGTWDISIAGWGPDWYGDSARSFFAPLFYGNGGKSGSAFPPNGSDFGFYDNPKVDALINKASTQASAAAAAKIWAQADKLVTNDAAIFPITADNQALYHASHVHNTIPIAALQQIDPTNVWLSS
ncbi:ABC transporter substrate-binding protein [uncultured Jatrophihabitans sp.]|uniref:ABC transporter substrate-binding protein n=1 Tax=uncultured Jatrophihabitans sp. TaxID=1610747 RepID=UPI0035CC19FD